MPKVTIKKPIRKNAKIKSQVSKVNKSKPKPAKANVQKPGLGGYSYSKNITAKQDKAYNSKKM
jgi:hypothetical protein